MFLRFRLRGTAALSATLALVLMAPALAQAQAAPPAASGPQPLVIGVDHLDLANQRPDQGRIISYTDFFARDVSIHSGDTLDFRFAPGAVHVVALAANEVTARAVYPLASLDTDDNHPATGTGLPKIELGVGDKSITGGSVKGGGQIGAENEPPPCGVTAMGQKPCTFTSASDIESSGVIAAFDFTTFRPSPIDWMLQVSAGQGDYDFFCYIHPGMRGKLHVVGGNQAASTQADIDATSATQFQADQKVALQLEQQYNVDKTTTDNGVVTHHVSVGVADVNNRISILEMLPQRIAVNFGDQVEFKWRDAHEVHTVGFAQDESQLPPSFVLDCGKTWVAPPEDGPPGAPPTGSICIEPGQTMPEAVGDPGNALSGAFLTNTQAIVNSGLLVGSNYGVQPTTQTWSVRTNSKTEAANYRFFCSVHDFMVGTVAVGL